MSKQGHVDEHLVVHELVPLGRLEGMIQDQAAAEDVAVNDLEQLKRRLELSQALSYP